MDQLGGRTMTEFQIVYADMEHMESFHKALSEVANEQVHIEMIQAPELDQVREFQGQLIANNQPSYFALLNNEVVGWCDVTCDPNPRLSHRGQLGMGVIASYREKGVGSMLLKSAIEKSKSIGIEKLELNVYSTNEAAIGLYEKFDFQQEGVIKNYRKLNGQYFDCILMALQLK
tara:strand:- start:147114 stop:147635 length:522 start_codon:yes stop_codon:yes gene_type:complete